tara:strand:+ start:711 stop:899 length:189 start_codon:yes stop_codon:yes gene_type:complete
MKPGDLVELSFTGSDAVIALVVHVNKSKKTWHRHFTLMSPSTGLFRLPWEQKQWVKVICEAG